MTPDDIEMAMRLIDNYWPGQARHWEPPIADAWRHELTLLDFDKVDQVLGEFHRQQSFRPDLSKFLELYRAKSRQPYKAQGLPGVSGRPPFSEWKQQIREANERRRASARAE